MHQNQCLKIKKENEEESGPGNTDIPEDAVPGSVYSTEQFSHVFFVSSSS